MAGPWEQYTAAPVDVPSAAPWEKYGDGPAQSAASEKSYFGLIPMAKALVKSAISGATLPGDVYSGRAQLPSSGAVPGSVPFGDVNSAGERVADLAFLASPINPAARAGDAAIPSARAVTAAPRYEVTGQRATLDARPVPPGGKVGPTLETVLEAPVSYAPNLRKVVEQPAAPTLEELQSAAKGGFEQAKGMGVEIAPSAMRDLGAVIEQQLQRKGILEEHAPTTYATLKRLSADAPAGAVSTIDNFHNLRQAFGNAAGSLTHPKESLAGTIGREAVDSYLSAIPKKDILAGPASSASAALSDAIGNYAAAARATNVGTRLTRAERQAARSGSGSNIENAIRQKISSILDAKGGTRGFSSEEVAQMEQIVRGSAGTNAARKLGKLGFNDGLSILLHAGAAGASGGLTIPLGIAGTAARKVAEAMTQRGANRLDEMIRMRSPLAASRKATSRDLTEAEQAARLLVTRALLESQSSRQ